MPNEYPNVSEPTWAIEMEARIKADNQDVKDKMDSLTLMVGALIARLGGPEAIEKAERWLRVPA